MENSIKNKYVVLPIKKEETYDWLLRKHYAKKIPSMMYSFGLYKDKQLVGCICYGLGANKENNNIGGFSVYELQRVVLQDNIPNLCSFFISKTYSFMPKPSILLSYSDTNVAHHGYIYQALNWLYSGISKGRKIYKDIRNIEWHEKTLWDKFGTNEELKLKQLGFTPVFKKPKHRYFYFLGTKKDKKIMKEKLQYPILPYPKGDNKRYDASYEPFTQGIMF